MTGERLAELDYSFLLQGAGLVMGIVAVCAVYKLARILATLVFDL